jgi:hypothetical protein
VAFSNSGLTETPVDLVALLPIAFDDSTSALMGRPATADLDLLFDLDAGVAGASAVTAALAVALELRTSGRVRGARRDLEAHLWSLVKPIGGVRLFAVALTERAHHHIFTMTVQVDTRGSGKKEARDRAMVAAASVLGSPHAPWQYGVVTGATVVMGPRWLPDENGAPRYVARYAVTAHSAT